MIETHVERNQ